MEEQRKFTKVTTKTINTENVDNFRMYKKELDVM